MSIADSQPLILVAEELSDAAMNRLRSAGRVVASAPEQPDAWQAHLPEAQALLVRTYVRVTPELLDRAPRLRVIGRAGVGVDNIDVRAAREQGVEVVHTPAASTRAVAELAIGMMIALQRSIVAGDCGVRGGAFAAARRGPVPEELAEQTLGIVGMGRIGQAVARRCRLGLGMRVLFNDIVDIKGLDYPAESVSKDRLYAESDVVSLHVPLTDQTRGLIGPRSLERFRPGAWLINTSRGPVVDSEAVASALESGHLGGAAFDVFEPEPPAPDHPLLRAPNCLLSPHAGARTRSSQEAMNNVVEDVIAVLEGREPAYPAP